MRATSDDATAPKTRRGHHSTDARRHFAGFYTSRLHSRTVPYCGQSGQPQNVKVTRSISPYWDARVVEAIQKPHFTLGKLDNETSLIEINLVVGLTR